jgi:hypothetical protein
MKNKLLIVVAVIAAVGIAYELGLFATKKAIAVGDAGYRRVTPFRADLDLYNFEKDRSGVLFAKKTLARTSSGITSAITINGPKLVKTVRVITFPDGASITINDRSHIKTTRLAKAGRSAARPTRPSPSTSDCTASDDRKIREELVLGQRTVVLEIARDNERLTAWKAPLLGCTALQYRIESRDGIEAPFALKAEGRLARLALDEPAPELVDAGSGYTELAPTAFEIRSIIGLGLPESALTSDQRKRLARLDSEYAKLREGSSKTQPGQTGDQLLK